MAQPRSTKTTITQQEFARLAQILADAEKIATLQDQLITEAYAITGEIERNGLTADAVFVNTPNKAEELCRLLGLTIATSDLIEREA